MSKSFNDIRKEAENDLSLDFENLDSESLSVPQKYQKYLDYFRAYSIAYKQKEKERDSKYRELYEYYRDHYSVKLKNTEIEYYVKSEEEYQKISSELHKLKTNLEYIEGILKQISQLNFQIKNAIEWQKFKAGLF